jgi:hypothetical protein
VSFLDRYLLEQGGDVRILSGPQHDVPAELLVEIPAERVTRTAFLDVNAIPKTLLGRPRVVRRGFEFKQDGVITALGHFYRNIVNLPDGQIGWYPFAVRAGSALIRASRSDVILAVGTPRTGHLVARTLAPLRDPVGGTQSRPVGRLQSPRTHLAPWPDRAAPRGPRHVDGDDDRHDRVRLARPAGHPVPAIQVGVVEYGFDPAGFPPRRAPVGLPLLLACTGRLYPRQDPEKYIVVEPMPSATSHDAIVGPTVRRLA